MMALGAKMIAIIPIMLGGLALFAAKALIISKVAFVLAIILGAQYLISNGGNFFNRVRIMDSFISFACSIDFQLSISKIRSWKSLYQT